MAFGKSWSLVLIRWKILVQFSWKTAIFLWISELLRYQEECNWTGNCCSWRIRFLSSKTLSKLTLHLKRLWVCFVSTRLGVQHRGYLVYYHIVLAYIQLTDELRRAKKLRQRDFEACRLKQTRLCYNDFYTGIDFRFAKRVAGLLCVDPDDMGYIQILDKLLSQLS